MRKITANYIFPLSSAPLKNGIIVLDDENRIIDIVDTGNQFREIANLEFYGGVIVPGFVDALSLLSYSDFSQEDFRECLSGDFDGTLKSRLKELQANLQSVQRGINHLEAFGTKAAMDVLPHPDSAAQKERSKVYFASEDQDFSYQIAGQEEQSSQTIALVNRLVLDHISKLPASKGNFCIGTGSLGTHQKLSVFEEMKVIQAKFPELSVWELIRWATLNPAQSLKIDHDFGSLEIGKKPGLNLISGIDFTNNRLNSNAELKILL